MIPENEKILTNYPFAKLEPPIKLVEGLGGMTERLGTSRAGNTRELIM